MWNATSFPGYQQHLLKDERKGIWSV